MATSATEATLADCRRATIKELVNTWCWEAEADIWFPSFTTGLMGAQTFASPLAAQRAIGIASPTRHTSGRLGYVLDNNWLLYGTAGFAFAYDKLQRIQLVGTTVNGGSQADALQNGLMWRPGWALGAGLEGPIAPGRTGKVEYQYASFGQSGIAFPAGTQVFKTVEGCPAFC